MSIYTLILTVDYRIKKKVIENNNTIFLRSFVVSIFFKKNCQVKFKVKIIVAKFGLFVKNVY